jgi:hypothetical protein
LLPNASAADVVAIGEILTANDRLRVEPTQFLLIDLPTILTESAGVDHMNEATVEVLLPAIRAIFGWIDRLDEILTQQLLQEIAPIFAAESHGDSASALMGKLRAWRQSFVLLANETLSPDAALVSEALLSPNDDPLNLLLTTLPSKLCEVRVAYGSWNSWQQHSTYVHALDSAAKEIAQRGHVQDATPHVQSLWEGLKSQMTGLSADEQRWLIKAFSEEFLA